MRKEFGWAIGIGIFFGLLIAFGLWRINSTVKKPIPSPSTNPSKSTAPPETDSPSLLKIVINKPENGDVFGTDNTVISGLTKSESTVILSTQDMDYILKADNSGLFEKEVELTSGINQIFATSLSSESQTNSKVIVIYSSAFAEEENSATAAATTEDIVNKQLKDIASKPKFFSGTVTDVTDTSIQLRTQSNEIKQVSIASDSTSVSNIKEKAAKNVKISDIAIGDYIAALGYLSNSSVLKASRILITNPISDPSLKVQKTNYTKGDLKTDKNTIYYKFENGEATKIKSTSLKTDDQIIFVEVNEIVRTVFVISN